MSRYIKNKYNYPQHTYSGMHEKCDSYDDYDHRNQTSHREERGEMR